MACVMCGMKDCFWHMQYFAFNFERYAHSKSGLVSIASTIHSLGDTDDQQVCLVYTLLERVCVCAGECVFATLRRLCNAWILDICDFS